MTSAADPLPASDAEPAIILRASIIGGSARYAVTILPVNGSRIIEDDYLRFALHYYARVLYELARTHHSVRGLPDLIDRVAADDCIGRNSDLFALAGVDGSALGAVPHPAGEVHLTLRRLGLSEFDLDAEIRLSGQTLAYSVLAVLQAILANLSGEMVAVLQNALANMNVSYTVAHRYSDPKSFREVPTIAYHAATFV